MAIEASLNSSYINCTLGYAKGIAYRYDQFIILVTLFTRYSMITAGKRTAVILQCRDELVEREKLMQEDVKVNKGLYEACKETLTKYKCPTEPKEDDELLSMSDTIMCLEEKQAEHKGNRK